MGTQSMRVGIFSLVLCFCVVVEHAFAAAAGVVTPRVVETEALRARSIQLPVLGFTVSATSSGVVELPLLGFTGAGTSPIQLPVLGFSVSTTSSGVVELPLLGFTGAGTSPIRLPVLGFTAL